VLLEDQEKRDEENTAGGIKRGGKKSGKENKLRDHGLEEGLTGDTGTGVDRELHLRDLLVDVLHELDDEVDELALVEGLGVNVGDEEGDVVHLLAVLVLGGDGLAAEDEEVVRALGKEAHEPLGEDLVELIELLQADRDADAVHAGLDKHTLLLVTRDHNGRAQQLLAEAALNLGLVVTLNHLRRKVRDAHRRSDRSTDSVRVRLDCSRHSL